MAGKGDQYRRVDPRKWSENYDFIFNKGTIHAPAPDTTTPHWDAFLCSCGIGYDPECEAQSAPAAEAPGSPSPAAGEDVLGCDSVLLD
jgi:hypothetical protein